MREPVPYNPDEPYRLSIAIERAERRLKILHVRREISAVDEKLKILETNRGLYQDVPPKAPEETLSGASRTIP